MPSLFTPTSILRKPNETNIGRFAFIEDQTLVTNKKIIAAFSHGKPLLNMGENYDAYPGEGTKNTKDFLKRIAIRDMSPVIFIAGDTADAMQITPTWVSQHDQGNDVIKTSYNFLWGKIDDFDHLTCLVKTGDCLGGMGLGNDTNNNTYFLFFHAGWRELNGNVIQKGLLQMQKVGCDMSTFSISIGPSISSTGLLFQNSDAVQLLDPLIWHDSLTNTTTDTIHLDIGQTAIKHMIKQGVKPQHIEWYNPNTNSLFDTFASSLSTHPLLFSHRAAKKGRKNGRNITAFSIQNID